MDTALARTQTRDLSIQPAQTFWTEFQNSALDHIGLRDADSADRAVFLHVCKHTGLDPFAKQIYMIGRNVKSKSGGWETKWTIQTAIDGFRLIARRAVDRAGDTLGYEDTQWCGPDGKWVDVWTSDGPPTACRVTVLRNGQRFPAVALFKEYAQTYKDKQGVEHLTGKWLDMQANQLAKVTEALALRKACPQDLSGIYSEDEMDQADGEHRVVQTQHPDVAGAFNAQVANQAIDHAVQRTPDPEPLHEIDAELFSELDEPEEEIPAQAWPAVLRSDKQSKNIFRLLKKIGTEDRDETLALLGGWIGHELESTKDLTVAEASVCIDKLKKMAGEDDDGGGTGWSQRHGEAEHIDTVTGEVT